MSRGRKDEEEYDNVLDLMMEDLTNLISPKNGMPVVKMESSPRSKPSTPGNSKVSPLITNEDTTGFNGQTSLRGVDANNQPIYASSQTPNGFQIMTKRKTGKKSIFNFEGFDAMSESKNLNASRDEAQYMAGIPHVKVSGDTPLDSPESVGRRYLRSKPKVNTSATSMASIASSELDVDSMNVSTSVHGGSKKSVFAFDSFDETAFKSSMAGFSDASEYLDALKWNGASPQNMMQNLPTVPTPKNPRKKLEVARDESESYDNMAAVHPMPGAPILQLQQPQQLNSNTQMFYSSSGGPGGYINAQQQQYPMYDSPNSMGANPAMMMSQHQIQQMQWMQQQQRSNDMMYGGMNQQYYPQQQPLPSIHHSSIPDLQYNYSLSDQNGAGAGYLINQNQVGAIPVAPELANYQALIQRKVQQLKISQQTVGISNSPMQQDYGSMPTESEHEDGDVPHGISRTGSGEKGSGGRRASKSLAEISKRFVIIYGRDNTMDYIAGKLDPDDVSDMPNLLHRVDAAADTLSVHVRRIYELIKILEILSLVQFAGDKRGKFSWRGTKDFLWTLGEIQEDGMSTFPLVATQSGLTSIGRSGGFVQNGSGSQDGGDPTALRGALFKFDSSSAGSFDLLNLSEEEAEREIQQFQQQQKQQLLSSKGREASLSTQSLNQHGEKSVVHHHHHHHHHSHGHHEEFMVETICKKFLQLFLVGVSLSYLSLN